MGNHKTHRGKQKLKLYLSAELIRFFYFQMIL